MKNKKDEMVWNKELGIYLLSKGEVKGLQDVRVFQLCECDAVAAYTLEEAKSWYKSLTGLKEDDLYSDDEIELVSPDYKVRKGEDDPELISVKEIVEMYWEGEPFIAITTGGY